MLPIRRILCPVDFSEFSRHALDQALAIARWSDATVTALHVVSPVPYTDPVMAPALIFTPEDIDRIHGELTAFITEEGGAAPAEAVVIESGAPAAAIVDEARARKADLIVIGTHGRSGLRRLMLGSVTERVLRRAECPVLTVPSAVPDAVPIGPEGFKHILCGVDFSPSSLKALAYAAAFARDAHAQLTLMHVADRASVLEPVPAGANGRELDTATRETLQHRLHEAAPTGGHVWEVIGTGKPYQELLRRAGEERTDLIVLGVHGGPAHLFGFGSTTSHVIREAACPVLSLRA